MAIIHINQDVNEARQRLDAAIDDYARILLLPRELDSKVRWPHNDVTWRRVGPNAWVSLEDPKHWPYPSSHIASIEFEDVS